MPRKNSKIHVVSLFAFTFAIPILCAWESVRPLTSLGVKTYILGVLFYNIFLFLFKAGIPVAALFNEKAKKWIQGRKGVFKKLEEAISPTDKVIWMHCASLGEFEQGRPLLERIRSQYPGYKVLLTFFSPSGYEVRKNYKGADWIFYLPMDGPGNARRFLEIVHPSLVIFVKYEFWYYYLKKIKYRNIPLILVSALFWEKMSFFKWYGAMQRKMLSRFDHLFVQDETSRRLMDGIGLAGITSISGDTRFDRVIDIAKNAEPVPVIEKFVGTGKVIIAGSTWPEDEEVLKKVMDEVKHPPIRLIIAPHEIDEKHIEAIKVLFPEAIRLSQVTPAVKLQLAKILIIDNIGLLSRLYKYAYITYIGGGFGKGIHNTLEAAVYGKPVIFGPVYHKFKEAADLINNKGAISVNNAEECIAAVQMLLNDLQLRVDYCNNSRNYVYTSKGATDKVISFIEEKKFL